MVAKLNRRDYGSDVMLSARRHLAAAIRMLNRATADATPDDDRIAAECDLFAVLERLGGPL
ncbi:MAG TPA: hypothetical protein VJ777_19295 [Mycobacterium sp.]|nr:hypothetical protein [Mycobacterium sp.]